MPIPSFHDSICPRCRRTQAIFAALEKWSAEAQQMASEQFGPPVEIAYLDGEEFPIRVGRNNERTTV